MLVRSASTPKRSAAIFSPMAQGLGFSIPLETIKSALARIYARREAPPAGISLGVGGMRVPLDPRLDIVIAAEGEPVTEPADLQRMVRRHRAGETMTLSFLRGGTLRQVTVVL